MAYVVIFPERGEPQRAVLRGVTVVGRALGCDICLDDRQLSRRHCCIEPIPGADGVWAVRDLGSRNGTIIDRKSVRSQVLKDGQEISVGAARIHFHASDRPVVTHRPSDPHEASRAPQADPRAETFAAAPARPLPKVSKPAGVVVAANEATQETTSSPRAAGQPTSLPFARPPARPIVSGGARKPDPAISSSWFSAVVHRLRRAGAQAIRRDDRAG